MVACHKFKHAFLPFFMESICRTLYKLVGAHAIDAAHKDIPEDKGIKTVLYELRRKGKAGILFKTYHIYGYDGYVLIARFFKGASYKTDIV